jgi:hypothetical protein
MRGNRLGFIACVLVGFGVLCSAATADGGSDAVITLGVIPLPPGCVQNPGGTATISWAIQHLTNPDHVDYYLYGPGHSIIYEQQSYPGSTGMTITRTWTIPSVLPQGVYWVRVEYYAQGLGLEAWAETGFLVCEPSSGICLQKRADENCDGLLGPEDPPVEGWSVGIITPGGQALFQETGPDGWACWTGLPYGNYTAFEAMALGWEAILPDSVSVTLGATPVEVVFLNREFTQCYKVCCVEHSCFIVLESECQTMGGYWHPEWVSCDPNPCQIYTPIQPSTWGRIKGLYR